MTCCSWSFLEAQHRLWQDFLSCHQNDFSSSFDYISNHLQSWNPSMDVEIAFLHGVLTIKKLCELAPYFWATRSQT